MITFKKLKDRSGKIYIRGNGEWVFFRVGQDEVALEGNFTIADLQQIISEMQKHIKDEK